MESIRPTPQTIDRLDLNREIERIWRINGVEIQFPAKAGADCAKPATVRVALLVMGDRTGVPPGVVVDPAALGSTMLVDGVPGRVMFVFTGRAAHLSVNTTHETLAGLPRPFSKLLGRVAAHELGHVLLQRTTHSASGLMRTQFDATDACCWENEDTYSLSAEERLAVSRLWSAQPASQGVAASDPESAQKP